MNGNQRLHPRGDAPSGRCVGAGAKASIRLRSTAQSRSTSPATGVAGADALSWACSAASFWHRSQPARCRATDDASAAPSVPFTNQGSRSCADRCSALSSGRMRAFTGRPRDRPGEARATTPPSMKDARLDRIDRAIDDARDLVVGQIVEIGEDEHASLFRDRASRPRSTCARIWSAISCCSGPGSSDDSSSAMSVSTGSSWSRRAFRAVR